MFSKLCALLRKKPVETKLPDFPVEIPVKTPAKKKKPTVAKATTRKPVEAHFVPAKKKAVKKAQTRLKKLTKDE